MLQAGVVTHALWCRRTIVNVVAVPSTRHTPSVPHKPLFIIASSPVAAKWLQTFYVVIFFLCVKEK